MGDILEAFLVLETLVLGFENVGGADGKLGSKCGQSDIAKCRVRRL